MEARALLTDLRDFVREAGAYGVQKQQTASSELKADASIVTEADLGISQMFRDKFGHYFSQPGHVLIDEETPNLTPAKAVEAEYQWVIDPIDGTATYAGGAPLWGIIVSVLRKGQPWVGMIYIPGLKYLFWADETDAYEEKEAFTPQATVRHLQPQPRELHGQSQIFLHQMFVNEIFAKAPCLVIDYWSPMTSGFVAAGYAAGKISHASLWDISAAWTLMRRLGYAFRGLHSGREVPAIGPDWFDDKWRLKEFVFMGPESVYEALKPHLKEAL